MAQKNTFTKSFLPGLVIGLVVGLPTGAYLSGMSVPILGGSPKQANASTNNRPRDERSSMTDPATHPPQGLVGGGENLLPKSDPAGEAPKEEPTVIPNGNPPVVVPPPTPGESVPAPILDPSKVPTPATDPAAPKKPIDPK